MRVLFASSLFLSFAFLGCQSTDVHPSRTVEARVPPPKITAQMPLVDSINAAIDFGGETMREVKLLIGRRGEWPKAEQMVDKRIRDGLVNLDDTRLVNAVHLYQGSVLPASDSLFERMVSISDRPLVRQLGWQIATNMPSRSMASAIERELTRGLRENDEDRLFVPQMASAVAANRLKDSYTVLVQGMLKTGHESFAKAMISLNAPAASTDFLDYLSRATVDELRQLTVSSINVYAAMVMLQHMKKVPPPMEHVHFDHLFLYSISRNIGLAEIASSVIQGYLPNHQDRLAIQLARQPAWIQIAYVESVRRKLTPVVGLFLSELKRATAQQDVVEEIGELRL